ncbi:Gfo/Idh/MocA family protein [Clostridium sp. Marseille-P3244]|uniref:Gfo/Idh/MocA family protein n=1 Tax=Clostridium sp. Marseille-P3244 TaxID=1871020 RepID=UPI000931BC57|nr:Gfo/Idh/MocA family oxidoreductase [Clostridium sp. Marseille-P3244]
MKIVVIGLGSMGKRRIRLIEEIYPEYEIFGIDGREDRRQETSKLFNIKCFNSTEEIEEKIDCVFICTSPLSHASIIADCLNKGWHVFTELNLVPDKYKENMALAKEKRCTLFLSSSFFYREEIKYIRSKIEAEKKWIYIYHIGQYLPDWHPWENYKDFFIGDKRTNGCREIMAIELPWLTRTFGDIESVNVLADKVTELNIGFEDNYMIQFQHKNGNKGTLIVDVVSPVAVRKLEVYAERSYLCWNGTPDSIQEFNLETGKLEKVVLTEEAEHKEGYSAFIVENMYKNEIREFFDVVLNGRKPQYGFEQDMEILELIDSVGA